MKILKESVLSVDSDGNELSTEQIEFFKDSKVRDENGNLLVCYHGSPNGSFEEFDTYKASDKKSDYQLLFGSHFTRNKDFADEYRDKKMNTIQHKKVNPKTYEVYLNITNPLNLVNGDISIVGNLSDKGKRMGLKYNELLFDLIYSKLEKFMTSSELKKSVTKNSDGTFIVLKQALDVCSPKVAMNIVKDLGYNGVIYNAEYSKFMGQQNYNEKDLSYIALEPNQIKSIYNKTPTDSFNINESIRG